LRGSRRLSTFGTAIALISRREDVAVRGRRSHAVLGAGILAATSLVGRAATAQESPPQVRTSLHVESSPRVFAGTPALEGYVYNTGHLRLSNIRLKVEVLDADGSVVEEAILEATGRSYRVSVLSFDENVDYRSRL
jgi:hypothetical protein